MAEEIGSIVKPAFLIIQPVRILFAIPVQFLHHGARVGFVAGIDDQICVSAPPVGGLIMQRVGERGPLHNNRRDPGPRQLLNQGAHSFVVCGLPQTHQPGLLLDACEQLRGPIGQELRLRLEQEWDAVKFDPPPHRFPIAVRWQRPRRRDIGAQSAHSGREKTVNDGCFVHMQCACHPIPRKSKLAFIALPHDTKLAIWPVVKNPICAQPV